jgi:type IV secretion system protein VirB9
MMQISKHFLMGALFLFLSATTNAAKAEAVHEYVYEPDRIYTVRTGLGITTQIELSPFEKVLDYSTGFSSGWELVRKENVFYIKPKNVDVDTNMVIRTETHSYILDLKVVATDWTSLEQAKSAGVHYKVKFKYPGDAVFSKQNDVVPQLTTEIDKDRAYHFAYDYTASRTLKKKRNWLVPIGAYDDGQFTYIRMSDLKDIPTGNFPAVFGREKESSEDFVVNTTVENNTIIVHGVYPYLVIRHGNNTVGLRRSKKQ